MYARLASGQNLKQEFLNEKGQSLQSMLVVVLFSAFS